MGEVRQDARPRVVLMVGLPGSGKSTYLRERGANAISTDAIRVQLADDETNQTINGRVFEVARTLLRHRMELRRPVTYVDATNLTRGDRRPFIKLAKEYGCRVEAVWLDAPMAVCRARNAARARVVPERILDLMAAKFVEPSIQEGFDSVEAIR